MFSTLVAMNSRDSHFFLIVGSNLGNLIDMVASFVVHSWSVVFPTRRTELGCQTLSKRYYPDNFLVCRSRRLINRPRRKQAGSRTFLMIRWSPQLQGDRSINDAFLCMHSSSLEPRRENDAVAKLRCDRFRTDLA